LLLTLVIDYQHYEGFLRVDYLQYLTANGLAASDPNSFARAKSLHAGSMRCSAINISALSKKFSALSLSNSQSFEAYSKASGN
jgi:hypothetical protein